MEKSNSLLRRVNCHKYQLENWAGPTISASAALCLRVLSATTYLVWRLFPSVTVSRNTAHKSKTTIHATFKFNQWDHHFARKICIMYNFLFTLVFSPTMFFSSSVIFRFRWSKISFSFISSVVSDFCSPSRRAHSISSWRHKQSSEMFHLQGNFQLPPLKVYF